MGWASVRECPPNPGPSVDMTAKTSITGEMHAYRIKAGALALLGFGMTVAVVSEGTRSALASASAAYPSATSAIAAAHSSRSAVRGDVDGDGRDDLSYTYFARPADCNYLVVARRRLGGSASEFRVLISMILPHRAYRV